MAYKILNKLVDDYDVTKLVADTYAELKQLTGYRMGSTALVIGDTETNNGLYMVDGTGTWRKVSE